jgi:tRNA(Ile)-lysidine synthase
MTPQPDFELRFAKSWPPDDWRNLTVLAAVSGGPDSVALLRALVSVKENQGKGRIVVGHFNHRLRRAAERDEEFVAAVCRELGVECRIGRATGCRKDDDSSHGGQGLEAVLRDERYQFLQLAAEDSGARYVVTAHTADDQAETILHRILRGTGLSGLGGMRRARPLGGAVGLIRPMLEFSRTEVLTYLATIEQKFRKDATNVQPRFTRNRIRRDLLPKLEQEYNPQVRAALLRLGKLACQAGDFLEHYARQHARNAVCIVESGSELKISVSLYALRNEPEYVVREVLRWAWREAGWPEGDMGFKEWDELASMASLAAPTDVDTYIDDRHTFPGDVDVWRRKDRLELRRKRVQPGS